MLQRLSFVFVLIALPFAGMADSGTVIRPASLHAEPYSDAATLSELGHGEAVTLLERRGGWYRVKAGTLSGWLRLASVKLDEHGSGAGESGIGQSLRFAQTGRSGARNTQATTGIRGLDKKALAEAAPNHAALDQLEQYAVSGSNAAAHARRHGLRPES